MNILPSAEEVRRLNQEAIDFVEENGGELDIDKIIEEEKDFDIVYSFYSNVNLLHPKY